VQSVFSGLAVAPVARLNRSPSLLWSSYINVAVLFCR
jgi:hypothetical protein